MLPRQSLYKISNTPARGSAANTLQTVIADLCLELMVNTMTNELNGKLKVKVKYKGYTLDVNLDPVWPTTQFTHNSATRISQLDGLQIGKRLLEEAIDFLESMMGNLIEDYNGELDLLDDAA